MSAARCSRRHNVLILDNEFEMGGLENKLFEFISRVDRDHFALKVCCLKSGGYFKERIEALGVPFFENLMTHKFDALAYWRLARILRDEEIDLVYTFVHPNTAIFTHLARSRGRVGRVVVSLHASGDIRSAGGGGSLIRSYVRPFLEDVDAFLAVANAHKRYLVEREGLDGSRTTVIYNGVDIDRFAPGPSRNGLADEIGVAAGDRVVVVVASLKPVKRIDLLLRAAAVVLESNPVLRVLVVGAGPDRDKLEALARDLGIAERVNFLGMRDDVPDVLRLGDLFVLSSANEAFPNAVLEAMACGLPVVSTDVGSVRELVADGQNGLVVPPNDSEALASAITRLAGHEETALAFGRRGREIVEANFKIEDMCAARERVFARLLCDIDRAGDDA